MEKQKLNFISSWDDGSKYDLRLVEMLKKYELGGIFFLNYPAGEIREKDIKEIYDLGFEIGGHTVQHFPDCKIVDIELLFDDISYNKEALQDIIGEEIINFCYPRGRYDQRVIDVIKQNEYKTARTTKVGETKWPDDFYQIKTSIHVFKREKYLEKSWSEMAVALAYLASQDNGLFHLWGHSKEIDKFGQWENLENFFKYLKENYQINNIKSYGRNKSISASTE